MAHSDQLGPWQWWNPSAVCPVPEPVPLFREIFIVKCAGQIVTITTVLCNLTLLANLQLIRQ